MTDTPTPKKMDPSYYEGERAHLTVARDMAARGDLLNAIRHAYWQGFHVGERDGHRGAASTHESAYEAIAFLEAVVLQAVGAGTLGLSHTGISEEPFEQRQSRDTPRSDTVNQYEYIILESGPNKVDTERLNEIGAKGWELVTVLERETSMFMIWKRERPGPTDPVKAIRDHVAMLFARHEDKSGCQTGADACSGILFFIDNDLEKT